MCRRLDELQHVIGVGDHRHVIRRDFDRGGTHALGEQTLGIGRDRLIAIGDHVPGRQRFPGRDTHHLLEGGRGQRLLHSVHDLCLHRINVSREVVHEVVLWQPGEALLVDAEVRQCRGHRSLRQQRADRFALVKSEGRDVDQTDDVGRIRAESGDDPAWEAYFDERMGLKWQQSWLKRKRLIALWQEQEGCSRFE